MRFGGLQKFTLSDYPGKVAAILFTQGCNFACPFCHNGSLIPLQPRHAEDEVSEGEIMDFLRARQGKLQGVVITGGEPTIHRDLPGFIASVKQLGYSVKLDTNGSNPAMVEELLRQNLVDFFAMDVKARWENYERLTGVPIDIRRIQRSMELIAASGVEHLFRTTIVPALHGARAAEAIGLQLPVGSDYILQEFNPANALDPFTCSEGDRSLALH
jgi:pyruvate formate lyase activating enzyme